MQVDLTKAMGLAGHLASIGPSRETVDLAVVHRVRSLPQGLEMMVATWPPHGMQEIKTVRGVHNLAATSPKQLAVSEVLIIKSALNVYNWLAKTLKFILNCTYC